MTNHQARRPYIPPLLIGALASVALFAVFPRTYLNTDSGWALVWGSQWITGHLPDYQRLAPVTPHPLTIFVSGVVTLGGRSFGYLAMLAITFLGYGAIVAAVFLLGRRAFGTGAGTIGAVLIACDAVLLERAATGFQDVPFAALVLWAIVLATVRFDSGNGPLALLALAGLVRPEAWLFSFAYLIALMVRGTVRPIHLALVVAPLGLWLACDLTVTGTPLFSFTHTREGAAELHRERGVLAVVPALREGFEQNLGRVITTLGVAGVVLAWWRRSPGVWVLAGAGTLALAAFVALGVAGVSLLPRYLLVGSAVLCVFAAHALTGWLSVRTILGRRVWAGAAIVAGGLVLGAFGSRLRAIDDLRTRSTQNAVLVRDLRDLLAHVPSHCAVTFPNGRPRPLAAYLGTRPLSSIPERGGPLAILAPSAKAPSGFFASTDEPSTSLRRVAYANASWIYEGCE